MRQLTECIFCGSKDYRLQFSATDRLHDVPGTYDLQKCCNCGLLFLNPQPESQDLAAHYPPDYCAYDDERPFDARDEKLYRFFYGQDSRWTAKLLHLPYRHALRTVVGGPGTRLLDIGCGAGHFMAMMKRALAFDVYGVEAFGRNDAFAKRHGLNIFHGTLPEAHLPDNFFDVVTMSHVLEHMTDARNSLQEIHRVLKSDGTLIIAIPNSASLLRHVFGKDWFSLDIPRHIFVPSVKNLARFCATEGFKLRRVHHCAGVDTFLRSSLYRLHRPLPPRLSRFSMVAGLALTYPINLMRLSDVVELILTPSA